MKICVVGAGLAGLTCSYHLAKKGKKVTILEKQFTIGGRAPKAVRVISKSNLVLLELIKDLEIEKELEEASLDKFGVLVKEGIVPMSKIDLSALLSPQELEGLKKLQKDLFSLTREKLHEISMTEFMQDYPEGLVNKLLLPMLQVSFEKEFEKMSAMVGVHLLKKFFGLMQEGGYILKGGPFTVVKSVVPFLEEKNCEIKTGCEVKSVEESENYVDVVYMEEGEEKSEKFEKVVLAIPLVCTEKILKEKFGIEYIQAKLLYVKGEMKEKCKVVLGADPNLNVRVIFSLNGEQYIYPVEENENIGFESIYSDFSLLGEEILDQAMPRIKPNSKIPELKHSEKIYLAGDFYYFPEFETAAMTGKKVAEMLLEC